MEKFSGPTSLPVVGNYYHDQLVKQRVADEKMAKAANNVAELINARSLKEHTQDALGQKSLPIYEKESLAQEVQRIRTQKQQEMNNKEQLELQIEIKHLERDVERKAPPKNDDDELTKNI